MSCSTWQADDIDPIIFPPLILGCKANHVDLTKAAFKSLSPSGGLDEGVLEGLKLYQHRTPNPWNGDLFGPIKLAL